MKVRNWEYQDNNSCARTDLLFRRDDEEHQPQIIRRPTQAAQPTRPSPGNTRSGYDSRPLLGQPERPRSGGSVGGSSRPPSSGPVRRAPSQGPLPPTHRAPTISNPHGLPQRPSLHGTRQQQELLTGGSRPLNPLGISVSHALSNPLLTQSGQAEQWIQQHQVSHLIPIKYK